MLNANRGFTLIELMTTMAILAVLSAIAIPNMIGWRAEHRLRGAVNNLYSDLQLSRLKAIRVADDIAIVFNTVNNSYEIFVDSNNNWVRDASEAQLRDVRLPPGIIVQSTSFASNRTKFNSRGLPTLIGTATFRNERGDNLAVVLNRVGRLRIQ